MSTVLGIDAGVAHIGIALATVTRRIDVWRVALFETKGLSKKARKKEHVSKSGDDYARCLCAMEYLVGVVNENAPDYIVAELPLGGARNAAAGKYLAMASVILAHVQLVTGKELILLSPYDVKRGFCGKTRTQKDEMMGRAFRKHPECEWKLTKTGDLHPSMEHPADAVAAIYAARHLQRI